MLRLRACLNCGHPADTHAAVDLGGKYVTHDGAVIRDVRLAGCQCGFCPGWDPDPLSRVSDLLGLDVRRVILT